MQKKIYFNNKPLFLVDKITSDIEDYLHQRDTIFIDELDTHTVKTMIFEMEQPEIMRGVFLYKDVDKLLEEFKNKLTLIQAAGGLVHTSENEVLLIFRRGKWDLPKGKLDEGENIEACALREITEETGLKRLNLEQWLCITYHTYHQNGLHILKESYWYLVKTDKDQEIIPQTDEDIEQCIWIPSDSILPYMDNTHASIKDVIKEGMTTLSNQKLVH